MLEKSYAIAIKRSEKLTFWVEARCTWFRSSSFRLMLTTYSPLHFFTLTTRSPMFLTNKLLLVVVVVVVVVVLVAVSNAK